MPDGIYEGWVGVFDSGVGGISVLQHLVAELPHESYVFFGDSAHAPYGEKSDEEVLALATASIERLIGEGCKAIVIACNTATSVAAPALRAEHPDFPIIGVEPALKPATLAPRHGRILVMATPITLRLDKYHKLAETWGSGSEILSVPCPGLAARIEKGNLDAPDLVELVDSLVGRYAGTIDSVVLGCTHYPFIKKAIREVLGDVPLYDGGEGTARELRRRLSAKGLLSRTDEPGRIVFSSSKDSPEELALYRWFFGQEA